jgi:hypothetical protein
MQGNKPFQAAAGVDGLALVSLILGTSLILLIIT